jgi:hypothetical protein
LDPEYVIVVLQVMAFGVAALCGLIAASPSICVSIDWVTILLLLMSVNVPEIDVWIAFRRMIDLLNPYTSRLLLVV